MVKNSTLIISILSIILLAYFVIAASGDGMKIISPSSGNGYSSARGIIFNVTYSNGTDILNPANATFYLNITGVWTRIGNTSASNGCNANSCAVNITNTTIPDGLYSVNATLYNSTASVSITNYSNLSNSVYFDGTPPSVLSSNISSPQTNGNYSRNIFLNTSAIDVTLAVSTVIFNITNSSNAQNASIYATQEGSTVYYSSTINTSHYPDGYYNITIYANDTVNNLNNSAVVYNIIFDNTKPSMSFSCDDYSVEEDDVITCTCNPSDALSGINNSYDGDGKSFTLHPSTTSTGNNQETTCTTQDTAGNFNTSTLYYNVTSGGTTGGSSSGGSSSGGSSSGGTGGGSNKSSSTNQSSNQSNNGANQLQGNQEDINNKNKLKINYWILTGVILGAGLIVGIIAFLRKKNIFLFKK